MGDKGYFPEGYPDEDFRSMVYRYKSRIGARTLQDTKDIMESLFGTYTNQISVLPRGLNHFVQKTNYFIPARDLIFKHSVYPIYHPFIGVLTERKVFIGMTSHNKSYPGRSLYTVTDNVYKFCSECLVSNTIEFGESYIHRIHQIDFVKICPLHQVILISHCPSCYQPLADIRSMLYQPASDCCPHCDTFLSTGKTEMNDMSVFLLKLANECKSLMEAGDHSQYLTFRKYAAQLWRKGYLAVGEQLDSKKQLKLNQDIISFFKSDNLNKIKLNTSFIPSLEMNKGKDRKTSPLVHFLQIIFLFGSLKQFLKYEVPSQSLKFE